MSKYLSTIYKDFNEKVVDSTTNIIPNLQSTKSLAPPLTGVMMQRCSYVDSSHAWRTPQTTSTTTEHAETRAQ